MNRIISLCIMLFFITGCKQSLDIRDLERHADEDAKSLSEKNTIDYCCTGH